jgi:hypothetical protein
LTLSADAEVEFFPTGFPLMPITNLLETMLAPEEHFNVPPHRPASRLPETLERIAVYRDWLTVLLAAGFLELDCANSGLAFANNGEANHALHTSSAMP